MTRIQATFLALALLLVNNAQQCQCFVARPQTATPTTLTTTTTHDKRIVAFTKQQQQQQQQQLPSTSSLDLYSAQFTASSSELNHRHASKDWLHNIKSLPTSSVLREVKNPVMAVLGWSTLVSLVHAVATKHAPHVAASMQVSSIAHSFLVSSIGLLLVFRTNSAYQRFYEGRRIWEEILSVSRNLSRLFQLYKKDIGPARQQRMRGLLASFPYLLRHHIRSKCLCQEEEIDPRYRLELQEPTSGPIVDTRFEGSSSSTSSPTDMEERTTTKKLCFVDKRKLPWSLLTPGALDKVSRARNRPTWVLDRLSREICSIEYDGINFTNRERQHFLGHVEKLTNAVGQCERIHQTAVPLNYARHSLRSLTMWLFTLPFCMVKDLGILTGPAAAVIAWLLFGVYQIGYSIEDPFQGSLRLSILCDAIRSDVMCDDDEEESASAFKIETQSWVDDATSSSLPPQVLPEELLHATTTPDIANVSPLFSTTVAAADYKALEP